MARKRNQIFVGNLAFSATKGELIEFFTDVGSVLNAEIVRKNGKPVGYAFVTFSSEAQVSLAITQKNGLSFKGRELTVSHVKSNDSSNVTSSSLPKSHETNSSKPVPFTMSFESVFRSILVKCCRGKLTMEVIDLIFSFYRQGIIGKWLKRVRFPYNPAPKITAEYGQVNGWPLVKYRKLQISIANRMNYLWKQAIDQDLTSRYGMQRALHAWCLYVQELEFQIKHCFYRDDEKSIVIFFNSCCHHGQKWIDKFDRISGPYSEIFLRLFYLLHASHDCSVSIVRLMLFRGETYIGFTELYRKDFDAIYNGGNLRVQHELWHQFDVKDFEAKLYESNPDLLKLLEEPYSYVTDESKQLSAQVVCFSFARDKKFNLHFYPEKPDHQDDQSEEDEDFDEDDPSLGSDDDYEDEDDDYDDEYYDYEDDYFHEDDDDEEEDEDDEDEDEEDDEEDEDDDISHLLNDQVMHVWQNLMLEQAQDLDD